MGAIADASGARVAISGTVCFGFIIFNFISEDSFQRCTKEFVWLHTGEISRPKSFPKNLWAFLRRYVLGDIPQSWRFANQGRGRPDNALRQLQLLTAGMLARRLARPTLKVAKQGCVKPARDRVAGDRNETRSLVMRKAIENGLPLVEAGGNADVLILDGELSDFLNELAKIYKRKRNSILLEALRRGVRAVEAHLLYTSNDEIPPEVSKMMLNANPDAEPLLREVRTAKIDRGALKIQLDDLLRHVPEAKRRADAIQKLTAIRRQPGGIGGGSAWGNGLSTEEMEWQVAMGEKYGANSANWPEDQKAAHAEWYDTMSKKYGHNTSWPQDEVKAHYAELKAKMLQ